MCTMKYGVLKQKRTCCEVQRPNEHNHFTVTVMKGKLTCTAAGVCKRSQFAKGGLKIL